MKTLIESLQQDRRLVEEVNTPSLPHHTAYTRLGVSQAKPSTSFPEGKPGVGVFAIRDIPKGTYVFAPDDDETTLVHEKEVSGLEPNLQKLYQDFCPKNEKGYHICPVHFNKMTPAWYVNESDQPNIGCDSELRFMALRDINSGEELLASYKDVSAAHNAN